MLLGVLYNAVGKSTEFCFTERITANRKAGRIQNYTVQVVQMLSRQMSIMLHKAVPMGMCSLRLGWAKVVGWAMNE